MEDDADGDVVGGGDGAVGDDGEPDALEENGDEYAEEPFLHCQNSSDLPQG